ncbi:hypothetical protein S7335_269 [Synechococcus sp. PCC 7335]|nr:hypothetical protein S7335_269 [Synechococcus sp. PCC 7335]
MKTLYFDTQPLLTAIAPTQRKLPVLDPTIFYFLINDNRS